MLDVRTTTPMAVGDLSSIDWISTTPPMLRLGLSAPIRDIVEITFDGKASELYSLISPTAVHVVPYSVNFKKMIILVEPMSLGSASVKVECKGSKFVYGPEMLLQIVSRLWHTVPGSVMDHEDLGLLISGREAVSIGADNIPYELTSRVKTMEAKIISVQSTQRTLQKNERLKELKILGIFTLPGVAGAFVYMQVITQEGSVVIHLSSEGG